jgi:hypothetical protein
MTASKLLAADERRRAARLARHYRDTERLSIREIAARLGRSPRTINAYLYDPDHSKAKAVKESYRGTCRRCGAPTSGSGPRFARELCGRCNGRATAKWTRESIAQALRDWRARYGNEAGSVDLSMNYARAHGGERLRRLREGWRQGQPWPAASVVQYHYGTVAAANLAAF